MADGADEFIETERKYDAAAGFTLPDLAGLDGVAAVTRPQTYRLRAIYFHTTDFRLAAAKITLRRRTRGTDPGWHPKLPTRGGSPREGHPPPRRRAGRGAAPSAAASKLSRLLASAPGAP